MKNILAIDIETFSPVDLLKAGVYPYAEHPGFRMLLFAYAFNADPVRVIDIARGEQLPLKVVHALTDENILKTAFNANFERVCLSAYLKTELPISQWECTMIKAASLGLPLSLALAGRVLKIEQGKMEAGKTLIRYFSVPCKPTHFNNGRKRNLPQHAPDKWDLFKKYCARDVEVERDIRKKLEGYETTCVERELYILDQRMNDRGVQLDMELVNNAIQINEVYREKLIEEAHRLTGLDNPGSVAQLKQWLIGKIGKDIESLSKETVKEILRDDVSLEVVKVLQLRQEMAKTSVKKYESMFNAVCEDGRVRGLLQFYGASRTGRWAGRLVQVQNLPQNHLKDLDLARRLTRERDLEMLELLYGNVPDTLSQLIRTAFVARPGCLFMVADFSAIEARVIAWLAGEKWRLDIFRTHGKIYEASASRMFKVPIEQITKGSPLRQKGKVAELALGYQGGRGALMQMGAMKMGVKEEELQGLVDAWRSANPAIVKLWSEVEEAAMQAMETGGPVTIRRGVKFRMQANTLFIVLPSGRQMAYVSPGIEKNRFGSKAIHYYGTNQTTRQWERQETYGGKLTENIVQAIARDCLAVAMLRLEKAGYRIVMHVHDEVIVEVEKGKGSLQEICRIMGKPIDWADELPLRADGYVTSYYKKD